MVSRSLCPDFVGSVFSYAPDSQSVNFISQAEVSQCFKVLNVRFCCFSLSLTTIIRVFGFWTDFWMMASCSRIHKMKKVSFCPDGGARRKATSLRNKMYSTLRFRFWEMLCEVLASLQVFSTRCHQDLPNKLRWSLLRILYLHLTSFSSYRLVVASSWVSLSTWKSAKMETRWDWQFIIWCRW